MAGITLEFWTKMKLTYETPKKQLVLAEKLAPPSFPVTVNYDLHTHLFTTWERGRLSFERAPRSVEYILNSIRGAGLDGIALVNFWDSRYEQFADDAREGRDMGVYKLAKELRNALIFRDLQDTAEILVLRRQEVDTGEGHLLVLGADAGNMIGGKFGLEKTLKAAEKSGALRIPDHWWGVKGIGKRNIIKHIEKYDALEAFNGNYNPPAGQAYTEVMQATQIHGIATSDAHNRKDLGNGHISLASSPDFSSEDNLRESLRDTLKKGRFKSVVRIKNSLASIFGHVFLVAYDVKFRKRLGLL